MQKGEWHWYTGALLLWGQMLPGENLQLTSQISKYFGLFQGTCTTRDGGNLQLGKE